MARNFSPTQEAGDMSDGFVQPPPDIYFVEAEKIELKTASTGSLYYNVMLCVVSDGDFKGNKFWDMMSLSKKALWKLGEFSISVGNQQDWDIENEKETQRLLIGKVGKCRTKWEEYEGTKRTKVQKWLLMEDEERAQYANRKTGGNSNLPDGPSPSSPQGRTPQQQQQQERDKIPF